MPSSAAVSSRRRRRSSDRQAPVGLEKSGIVYSSFGRRPVAVSQRATAAGKRSTSMPSPSHGTATKRAPALRRQWIVPG